MITIIADRYHYYNPPSEALIATGVSDYIPVRRRIRKALDQSESLVVYATDTVVLRWLADLQRYPESHVTWQVVDPSEDFVKVFGVSPTPPFTPACIAALQLHKLPPVPVGHFVQPLSWILGNRLHPVWQHDEPVKGHAAELSEWAIGQTQPFSTDIITLMQAQIERWSAEQPIYCTFHAANIADDGANLLVRWALGRYDLNWRNAQIWGYLPLIEGEPSHAAVQKVLHGQYSAIQAYWNRQIARTPLDTKFAHQALAQMSGMSKAEIDAITIMIGRHPDMLDKQLLEMIQMRFAHLPDAQSTLNNLAAQIAQPTPQLPNPMWSREYWLKWATQHYMPYFSWIIQSNSQRDYQQKCAIAYSDWLYKQYPSWLNDDQSPLLLHQYQDLYTIIEDDSRTTVIWLVIDGMTWWQGAIMIELCRQYELYVQSQQVGVAILPSITCVSKRALITGQPTIDLTQPNIAEAARVKLARSNIPAIVGYDLSTAIETLQQDHQIRVAVVFFNLIDTLAHQTNDFTDNPGIRGYLHTLASKLGTAQQMCSAQGRQLHILIGSDHGSTILPKEAQNLSLPNTVCEVDDIWEPELNNQETQKSGTRAAATDLDRIPHVDNEFWYVLDRDRFQLDRHYLVPRGYNYIKRRPSAWTHGGLTPEETIVPLLHLAATHPRLLPLEIESGGSLRVGQASTITVTVRNLNPFPLQDVMLTFAQAVKEISLAIVGPLEQQNVEVAFTPLHTQGAAITASYEVRYNAFGAFHHNSGQVEISVRRLQTQDTSFDDMFN